MGVKYHSAVKTMKIMIQNDKNKLVKPKLKPKVEMTAEYKVLKQLIVSFVFLRLVYLILPVSLDCPFLIAPWVFSNVYSSALTG